MYVKDLALSSKQKNIVDKYELTLKRLRETQDKLEDALIFCNSAVETAASIRFPRGDARIFLELEQNIDKLINTIKEYNLVVIGSDPSALEKHWSLPEGALDV